MEKIENNAEQQKLKIEEKEKIRVNVDNTIDNGDVIFLDGINKDELFELARIISKKLGDIIHDFQIEKYKQSMFNGEEIRPGGCFAIKFEKERLRIDNRNARGNKHIRRRLEKAVNSAIKNYYGEIDEEEIFENKKRELGINIRNNGNDVTIEGPDTKDLIDIGLLICKKLNNNYIEKESDRVSLLSGEKIKALDYFIAYYENEKDGMLCVYTTKGDSNNLEDSVEFAIQEYCDKRQNGNNNEK